MSKCDRASIVTAAITPIALTLALGLLPVAPALAQDNDDPPPRTLTVMGYGEVKASPDLAFIELAVETGVAHFWSRSRGSLWRKGKTSGETLNVVEIRTDCDQDALLLKVEPQGVGAACHTGRRSCFYRKLGPDGLTLSITSEPLFDPKRIYRG